MKDMKILQSFGCGKQIYEVNGGEIYRLIPFSAIESQKQNWSLSMTVSEIFRKRIGRFDAL